MVTNLKMTRAKPTNERIAQLVLLQVAPCCNIFCQVSPNFLNPLAIIAHFK